MSEETLEIARAFTEAFNAGDTEALVDCCDTSVDLHSSFSEVGGADYHGRDGIRKWYRDMCQIWGGRIRSEPEALFDLGEQALVYTVLHGRGQQSGAEVAVPAAMVVTVRQGLVVYFRGYAHREDAVSDLGVSEDALEPVSP